MLKMKHSANRNQKGHRFCGHLFPLGPEEVHVEAWPQAPLAMNYVVFREFSAPAMSLPLERELMDGNGSPGRTNDPKLTGTMISSRLTLVTNQWMPYILREAGRTTSGKPITIGIGTSHRVVSSSWACVALGADSSSTVSLLLGYLSSTSHLISSLVESRKNGGNAQTPVSASQLAGSSRIPSPPLPYHHRHTRHQHRLGAGENPR